MDTKPQDPKNKILSAARTLFANQGFEATTVRQICELAAVNQALVSYYFGGKESLYSAVFDHFLPIPEQMDPPNASCDPIAALQDAVKQIVSWRLKNPEMIRIAQREMMSSSSRLSNRITRAVPIWETVRSILASGRKQGVFHFQSLDYTLFLVMGSLMYPDSYPLHDALRTEKKYTPEVIIEETFRFIMRGIGAKASEDTD